VSDQDRDLKSQGKDMIHRGTRELSSALTPSGESRLKQWMLLTGNRMTVAAVLLASTFVVLFGLGVIRPVDMRRLLTETNAVNTLFGALLSGAILLVSIVVSINSVVLSQEITGIEDQEERISASIEYRQHIEGFIDADLTPARPAEFLAAVLYAVSEKTDALVEIAGDSSNEEFEEHAETFAESVAEDILQARDRLQGGELGTFPVLLAGLNYNYSGQLHAARGFKRRYADELSEDDRDTIDDLIDTLTFVGTGREYFKSLYYERELARLSSRLLYVSLPVLVVTSYVLLALNANFIPEARVFGVPPLLLFVSVSYTIALAPYVVLTSYIIRAATITLRTLAAGPFILQSGSSIDAFDWADPDEYDWEFTEDLDDG
jgi:hypothetical protein